MRQTQTPTSGLRPVTGRRWLIALLAAALTGCGGGGGGNAPAAPPVNTAPSVNAGVDQVVARNIVVTLSGTASDTGGSAGLSYSWQQTAGTAVMLLNADSATASFTSPDVPADETLSFSLSVSDSGGLSGSDTVSVDVLRNTAPVVDAGPDLSVQQNNGVNLDASADDDDGEAGLTYAWTQVGGTTVSLNNADTASATFTAPATTGIQTLVFRITVTDAFGETGVDEVDVSVFEDINSSSVSGTAQYQFVPFSGGGLNYAQAQLRPIRGATLQVIEAASNNVLAQMALTDSGKFVLPVPSNTNIFLRVRAELKRSGTPAWDVEVRDNTSATSLSLSQRPLYVLDGSVFNSGSGGQTVNLQALSGWTGASYGNTRAAAPFSILDVIYDAMQMVVGADSDAVFAPLDAFWSVNNSPTVDAARNFDTGEIGTSFYSGGIDSLFLLGQEDADTEEFDTHVIAHEWGHYFEDNFSRSDSIGGRHNLSDRLDPRLAFGEGFGNAVSAMITGSPVYFDTQGSQQASGFSFSLESNATTSGTRGWYNERSIQVFLYDIFDSNVDVGDTIALGFGPIYDVLTNEQASGVPFTTIYPFVEALRNRFPAEANNIDALLLTQRINGDNDGYGSNEVEAAGRPDVVLPIYSEVVPGGGPVNVCSTNVFDTDEDGNKLSVRRFLRFSIASAATYTVNIVTTNPPAVGQSDPDAFVFRGDFVGGGNSGVADRETFALDNLQPGDYVMELYEYSYLRDGPAAIAQPDNRTCFDVTIN